jgi:hypothetical protein
MCSEMVIKSSRMKINLVLSRYYLGENQVENEGDFESLENSIKVVRRNIDLRLKCLLKWTRREI